MTTTQKYVGEELELFAGAARWKQYFAAEMRPFLGKRVLEVGAGIGSTTTAFSREHCEEWVCMEPDESHVSLLREQIVAGALPSQCSVFGGTVSDLDATRVFDTILYIDVLEHILDDRGELANAARHLARGGHLIVLSPAHQWLYSPFDRAVGHHRRYTKASLRAVAPPDLTLARLSYLDSVGLAASLANRVALRQAMPTRREILLWDRFMVRASQLIDPLLMHRIGKSVLGVWRRDVSPGVA